MTGTGKDVAARARNLVGIRFRPQGRDPDLGLDCVGVAAISAQVPADKVPGDYALRGQKRAEIEHSLCDLGLQPVVGESSAPAPGDLMLFEAGPAQFHLAVVTGEGFVHADAGLGMVVERPLPAPWPLLGLWRLSGAL